MAEKLRIAVLADGSPVTDPFEVRLPGTRIATLSVRMTSNLGHALALVVRIDPEGQTEHDWFRIPEPEYPLTPGASVDLEAVVAVSADVRSGSYVLRIATCDQDPPLAQRTSLQVDRDGSTVRPVTPVTSHLSSPYDSGIIGEIGRRRDKCQENAKNKLTRPPGGRYRLLSRGG